MTDAVLSLLIGSFIAGLCVGIAATIIYLGLTHFFFQEVVDTNGSCHHNVSHATPKGEDHV
jgi:hypothetical protein